MGELDREYKQVRLVSGDSANAYGLPAYILHPEYKLSASAVIKYVVNRTDLASRNLWRERDSQSPISGIKYPRRRKLHIQGFGSIMHQAASCK